MGVVLVPARGGVRGIHAVRTLLSGVVATAGDDTFGDALDHAGARRLRGAEEWVWYVVAAVSYIVAGIWQKGLLNWFVGPAWVVAVITLGPVLVDRVRRRRETQRGTEP